MAKYKNRKTGVILETECKISGGDWVEVKAGKGKGKTNDPVTENEGGAAGEGVPANGDGTDNE